MKKILYILIICLTGSSALYSQEKLLSLSEAINNTLENNYGIIISSLDEDAAALNNTWGNAGRLPGVGFDLNSQNSIRYSDGSQTTNNNLIADLGIGWKIFDGFKVRITKEKLQLLEELSQGQSAVVIENTLQNLIMSYYFVLLQQENMKVLEDLLKLSKDRYDYENARFELGGAVSVNVLLAKSTWLSDKTAYLKQKQSVRESFRTLNFIMSEKDNRNWNLSNYFEADSMDYALSELMEKMLSSNYVLKNQYINQSLKEKERKLRKSDLFPELSVSGGVSNSYNSILPEGGMAASTNTFSPYGNISFSYDIFTGGIRKTAIAVAEINEEISAIQSEEMVHNLSNMLLSLYDSHLLKKELLLLANENLEVAKLNLQIAEQKYRNGSLTSFEFRDVQLIHLNTSLNRLSAIYDLIYAETEITRLTGGFLDRLAE